MSNVDGFLFEEEEWAAIAQKEEEGVRFIKEHTALDNVEVVFSLYRKLVEQELFITPVGHRFLVELQNILLSSSDIARAEIPPIKVIPYEPPKKDHVVKKMADQIGGKVGENYRRSFYVAVFFAVIFGLSVVGMFVINKLTANNVNILNYRETILNEYAGWDAELEEKENRLRARENELEEREKQLEEKEKNVDAR